MKLALLFIAPLLFACAAPPQAELIVLRFDDPPRSALERSKYCTGGYSAQYMTRNLEHLDMNAGSRIWIGDVPCKITKTDVHISNPYVHVYFFVEEWVE